jgi:hypothetical protein
MKQKRSFFRRLRKLSFSDKVAGLALIIAAASIIVSVWTTIEQKRQWRVTNLGRVELVDAGFVYWRSLPLDTAKSTKWGYNALFAMRMDNRIVTGEYLLMNRLVVFEPKTKKYMDQITGYTVDDIVQQLGQMGKSPSEVELQQYCQIEFEFENAGASPVKDVQIEISGLVPDIGVWQSMGNSQPTDLAPAKKLVKIAELHMALGASFPDKLSFQINTAYTNGDGQRVTKTEPVYYIPSVSAWKFGY